MKPIKHEVQKIRSVSMLPAWFRSRVYRKQLSDVDWFREIRRRQILASSIEMMVERFSSIEGIEEPLAWSESTREALLELLEMLEVEDVRPDSMVYYVPQHGVPVRELTVEETTFLGFALRQSNALPEVKELESLLEKWQVKINEFETIKTSGGEMPLTYGQYDRDLAAYVDIIDSEKEAKLESPIERYYGALGNPYLSYGRPLNGCPITINTSFDDETILKSIKEWLMKKRNEEESKARRPLNQSDFDDWEFYKIREIFDLEAWATITNTKILDRVMAEALWPNAPDGFSPIDVLRTTARKKTKSVFQFETVVRLYGQLRLEKGENFLTE